MANPLRTRSLRPIYANLIIGNRFVHVHARSVPLGGDLTFTADDLLAIAEEINTVYQQEAPG